MPQAPYVSTDPNAGMAPTVPGKGQAGAPSPYLSTDPSAGAPPSADAPAPVPSVTVSPWQMLSGAISGTGLPAIVHMLSQSPVATVKNAWEAYVAKGRDLLHEISAIPGHPLAQSAARALAVAAQTTPTYQSMIAPGVQKVEQGNLGWAVGHTLGAGAALAMMAPGDDVPAEAPPLSPVAQAQADVTDFAGRHDIPLDAATATNHPFVRTIQKAAGESALGRGQAARMQAAQAQAMDTTAQSLAGDIAPVPVSPEEAGAAIQQGVTKTIQNLNAQQDAAYGRVRALEGQATPETRSVQPGAPVQGMRFPVDIRQVKNGLGPLYADLKRQAELIPLQGGKAQALVAMDRLISGPDFVPLSTADRTLGDLKAMARGADLPELRTAGQGTAARGVSLLSDAVDQAAAKGGPEVTQALAAGRAATKAKWAAADVLDRIRTEPVKAFEQATARGDGAIAHLRSLQQVAPEAVPLIGRAWLEQAVDRLHLSGTEPLDRAQGALRSWEQMGPLTKQALFGDAEHVRDIGQFFKLAQRMAKNPNPSGSGAYLGQLGEAAAHGAGMSQLLMGNPWPEAGAAAASLGGGVLARLLYSPAGAKLLTRGIALPEGSGAAAAWAGQVSRAMQAAARGGAPAVAQAVPATGGR